MADGAEIPGYPYEQVAKFLHAAVLEGRVARCEGVIWHDGDMRAIVRGQDWSDDEWAVWRKASELATETFGYWCLGEQLPCLTCVNADLGDRCARGDCQADLVNAMDRLEALYEVDR